MSKEGGRLSPAVMGPPSRKTCICLPTPSPDPGRVKAQALCTQSRAPCLLANCFPGDSSYLGPEVGLARAGMFTENTATSGIIQSGGFFSPQNISGDAGPNGGHLCVSSGPA